MGRAYRIAALLGASLAAPALAQSAVSQGENVVLGSGAVSGIETALGALMALWGIAFWTSVVLLGLYYAVMIKLAPSSWSRWSYLADLVDRLKWTLIAVAVSPFAVALAIYGLNAVASAWGVSTGLDPAQVASQFLSDVLFKGIADAFRGLRF
ncbi:MAG: hypothetical protein ACP5I3_07140 [Thermoproteus sp.]|jgi:hypothetical protein